MQIFLEMSNKRIVIEVSDEKNTDILAEIKRQVYEKENIPEEQQNIYVDGVLLTGKHDNTFIRAQLEKQKYGANLEVLDPEQVTLYRAIQTLDLPPQTKMRNDERVTAGGNKKILILEDIAFHEWILAGRIEDIKYLSALSKALDESAITHTWKFKKGSYRLHIDYPDQVLSGDFAEKLKVSYEKELAKIENSLFYVSDPAALVGG